MTKHPKQLAMYFTDDSVPDDIDSGAEASEDEPTMVTPLRDDAVVTNSLHNGGPMEYVGRVGLKV